MTRRNKVLGTLLLVVIAVLSALALLLSHDSPCGAVPPSITSIAPEI